MNYTQKDEEKYKKKTISSINTIKRLHEKKEEIKKLLPGRQIRQKGTYGDLKKIEDKTEEVLLNLKLNKKILVEIIRKIAQQVKSMNTSEARIVRRKLTELSEIENGLKIVRTGLFRRT
jgi:hypothetical protein